MKKIINKFVDDESGNVLLFSILALLFLVFLSSVISISVINRANTARNITDSNKVVSQLEERNANIENSINEVIFQNDELARYYMSMKYYNKSLNSYSTGVNSRFDTYLGRLITSDFQQQIKAAMSNTRNLDECTKVLLIYLNIKRITVDANSLLTYQGVIDVNLSASYPGEANYERNISIKASDQFKDSQAESYANIKNRINDVFMLVEYTSVFKISDTSSMIEKIKTNMVGEMKIPSTLSYDEDADKSIIAPDQDVLKNIMQILKYDTTNIPR